MAVAFFAAVISLGLLTVVGMWRGAVSAHSKIFPLPKAPYYLAYLPWTEDCLDHHILFHGLGKSRNFLNQAEILFLGNSRTQFGFSENLLTDYFNKKGLKYFNLSFGHTEGIVFEKAIIDKHKLRPQWIVVNADGFFSPLPSPYGRQVMNESAFVAQTTVWENQMSFAAHHRLQWLFPSLLSARRERAIYRSWETGSWQPQGWTQDEIPIQQNDFLKDFQDDTPEKSMETARRFQAELATREGRLILTWIPSPSPHTSLNFARKIAHDLNVPFIAPVLAGLATADGSHLSEKSAQKFTISFLKEADLLGIFNKL